MALLNDWALVNGGMLVGQGGGGAIERTAPLADIPEVTIRPVANGYVVHHQRLIVNGGMVEPCSKTYVATSNAGLFRILKQLVVHQKMAGNQP
jgi:hypothetical protein